MPGPNKKTRIRMPERPASVRAKDFEEVPEGFSDQEAAAEAARCIQCKKPFCVEGCPVNIDIPGFLKLVAEGKFIEAGLKLKEQNALPAVCGRVCPQETQCEAECILGRKGESVAIGDIERFAADHLREAGMTGFGQPARATGYKVAIVGAGPAGLTAAGELARMGHGVVVFEALHEPGGVLMYGIPEFRLPKQIVKAEVENLESLGVKLRLDMPIGLSLTIEELLADDFDAVFIGAGAGLPRFLEIPGENLVGVFSANEYLTRVNLMRAWDPESPTPILKGRQTVVFGGGNVALDSARSALRVSAGEVTLVYRRTKAEMPARANEIHHAAEEGIRFEFLSSPVRFVGDGNGRLSAVECLRMELGEPDESGRRRPVPIEGSEYIIPAQLAIVAIGNRPNPLIGRTTDGLKVHSWGGIITDGDTGATSIDGVFAAGDVVTGAATVIEAMGAAKKASAVIDSYLRARSPQAAAATGKARQ